MVRKTTVYLDEAQAERLGRLASARGRSQAGLIREGVERVKVRGSSRPR